MRPALAAALAALTTAGDARADDELDAGELSDEELDAELADGADEPIPDAPAPPTALHDDGTYGRYTDVRVRYSHGAGSWGTEIQPLGILVSETRDGSIDRERSVRLDFAHSRGLKPGGGWFYGLGFEYARATGSLMTDDASRSVYGMHLLAGWAKPFGSRVQLELGIIDQLGFGSLRDTFPGASTPTLDGFYMAGGLEASLVYTDISGWQLAFSGGARYFELYAKNPDMYKAKTVGTSAGVGVFLGKRY